LIGAAQHHPKIETPSPVRLSSGVGEGVRDENAVERFS
jgi:hypothetical protein